ncbi:MAG: TolC family outer membrane protein [Candidatus Pelagadaptatus aseana]|uniref:TolC family outer membrane protein n=1 Tax=Candidatus Pelagadaptatus aseana TaxID=3120508 RepID=UPI0039B1E602
MIKKRISMVIASAVGALALQANAETLKDIYTLALDNDPQLRADTAAYEAGKEALTLGRANLLPQINAVARYGETDVDSIAPFGGTTAPIKYNTDAESNLYQVNLTQPLFNMAAWFGYEQGKSLSQLAEAQFSADQQNLIVRVSEAYFNVLRAIDNMETAQAEETALGHQLEQTRQRFEVGLTAITDVHEAQAAYDNATASTLGARGQLGIAYEELEVITGQAHNTVAPLVDEFPVVAPAPSNRAEWVDTALTNNYSLKVAKLNSDAAKNNAKSKSSGHLPTISASLSYTDMNDTNADIESLSYNGSYDSRDYDGTAVAIQLDVPIYSGHRVSGERRQAYAQSNEAKELYNKAQRDTIQGARALHLSVVTGVAQVKARNQAITSSTSALEATQAGYEVGTRNLVDVLVAQRNLYSSQRNYDNTRYDYIINMLKLKEVAGNLTPDDVLKLDKWLDSAKLVNKSDYD